MIVREIMIGIACILVQNTCLMNFGVENWYFRCKNRTLFCRLLKSHDDPLTLCDSQCVWYWNVRAPDMEGCLRIALMAAIITCIKMRSQSIARQLQYRCIDHSSTAGNAMFNTALKLKLILLSLLCCMYVCMYNMLQYRTAVVGAETAFRALQPQCSQLQWTRL